MRSRGVDFVERNIDEDDLLFVLLHDRQRFFCGVRSRHASGPFWSLDLDDCGGTLLQQRERLIWRGLNGSTRARDDDADDCARHTSGPVQGVFLTCDPHQMR